jgi:tRNA G18 (ribose-2'-O)-methylase SpoU
MSDGERAAGHVPDDEPGPSSNDPRPPPEGGQPGPAPADGGPSVEPGAEGGVPSEGGAQGAVGGGGEPGAHTAGDRSDVSSDERVLDEFRALNDPVQRRRIERHAGFFVVEGMYALDALLRSAYPMRTVLAADNKAERVRELAGLHGHDPGTLRLVVRPAAEVAAITGFAFHRGVLASADRLPLPAVADVVTPARLLLVIVGVNDHENLGALFRNAAAFGVDGVLLDSTTPDPLYRRSVRVSAGHVLRIPWTRLDLDVVDAFAELRASGYTVVALTPAADAAPIDAVVGRLPPRVAMVVGAEWPGLKPAALAAADLRVRVPLVRGVDSLNVATAAAVALHRLADLG